MVVRNRVREMDAGQVLHVLADDPSTSGTSPISAISWGMSCSRSGSGKAALNTGCARGVDSAMDDFQCGFKAAQIY